MTKCDECEEKETAVKQAESAVNHAIKRLDLLSYAQVLELQSEGHPLRKALRSAQLKLGYHRRNAHGL